MIRRVKKVKKFFNRLGPGFVTGASDDDPTGIATYTQTGALFGYQQVWTAPFSLPFMVTVQEISGRIGIVTGRGLAAIIHKHYPRPILLIIVFSFLITNIISIGANLGAMTSSLLLVVNPSSVDTTNASLKTEFIVVITAMTIGIIALQILVPYKAYMKILKYLALSLLAYIAAAFFVQQDLGKIAASLIPTITFNQEYLLNIVAIFGTTISPYLFFWQTGQEVEEAVHHKQIREMNKGRPKMSISNIKRMRKDTVIGMFFSNLVMFFIIITAAATLHTAGITDIKTATDAAQALEPFAGNLASALFALGIVGTGLLAIPVLAGSASYAVSEFFNWKAGLSKTARQAVGFYSVIALSILIGLFMNFLGIPIFKGLYYAAMLNGLIAPPIIFLMLRISSNKKIMGPYANSRKINVLGYTLFIFMTLGAILLLASFLPWF
ncbi:MAG: divalent metal cation transporter [Candidatus Spechtbacteria bacterium SB0662_bin_43]|uniref:Divalent metal cation transporter n=1 Tax=Candidatus Spechtbacteria bacterium SB0662_bin_43 TaxID=2604897 RepID=A0A845DLK3_9BACT|nr:divalent metal cation transporter [Candidatus Spechtbacteria bacterium SB0662_bin_43]